MGGQQYWIRPAFRHCQRAGVGGRSLIVLSALQDGTHQPPLFVDEGVPFIFVQHIVAGAIRFDNTRFISAATFDELNARCPVEVGDILYSAVGSYGVAVPVRTSERFSFQRHIAHIKPDKELAQSYIVHCLNSPRCLSQSHKVAEGWSQRP